MLVVALVMVWKQVMMNATLPPSKRSRVEREMDWLILFMFALLLVMCIIGAVAFSVWTHHLSPDQWYATTIIYTLHLLPKIFMLLHPTPSAKDFHASAVADAQSCIGSAPILCILVHVTLPSDWAQHIAA